MTKRYGIATPEDLERQERERRRKEAEYQALLMPEPGTAAWDKGLETSTPFFDILTGGVGGLGMKGIAKLGGLLGKRGGSGVLDTKAEELARKYQEQGDVLTAETLRAIPGKKLKYVDRPGGERPSGYSATKPTPDFDLTRSPYDIHFDEFNALSPTLQARLLRHHNIEPNDLMRHHYDSGGRERLVNLYHYSIRTGQPESAKAYKMLIDQNDARYGYNVETIDPLNRVGRPRKEPPVPQGVTQVEFRSPLEMDFKAWGKLSTSDQDRLIDLHKIDPNVLAQHMYDNGGRNTLIEAIEQLKASGLTNSSTYRRIVRNLEENDRVYGYNVETFRDPSESPFWWDQ